jgi:hypothetical protein
VKVQLSPCSTNKALRHEDVWGSECIDPRILDLARSYRSASRPGCFTPGERGPGTHWIGGWVDPRTSLDDVERRTILHLPELELRALGRPPYPAAIPSALSRLPES